MNIVYKPIIAEAHTPPYKVHRYFARRPWNVFRQLLEVYSGDNEVVLDPFCGGGVTVYEGIRLHRRLLGFDINPLSIFIVENMLKKDIVLSDLDRAFDLVREYIVYLYGDYNTLIIKAGEGLLFEQKVDIEWNELAFNLFCHYCGAKVSLSNKNRISNGRYSCSNRECSGSKERGGYLEPKDCKRDSYSYLFSVATSPYSKEKIIVEYDSKRESSVQEHISFLNKEIKKNKVRIQKEKIPLNWDRQHEDLLHKKGIMTFQDFFTERNLLINLLILNLINKLDLVPDVYKAMRLVFSSCLRDTNIMSFTNEDWQSGKPTTWSKHAYWVPSQFCEVSVLPSFDKAFNRFKAAVIFNKQFNYNVNRVNTISDILSGQGNLFLRNSSVEDCKIPPNSIDTIITDPPYGSNVQYLELSHFWYVWNKDLYGEQKPNFLKEAVCNRKKNFTGAKSMKDYESNLFRVFAQCYKVLKPNHNMILTFNNKDMGAWLALLIAIFRSGFVLEKDGLYFQDGVSNYKQTAHTKYEGSPYGDFIYIFKKEKSEKVSKDGTTMEVEFIKDLDSVFKYYLTEFKLSGCDRNIIIRNMFLSAIPKVENFVKKSLPSDCKHNLYSHFKKDYLKDIYS